MKPMPLSRLAAEVICVRIGRPVPARLVDLPRDLRRAVVLLARQFQKQGAKTLGGGDG